MRESALERVAERDNTAQGYREGWPVAREARQNARKELAATGRY